MKNSILHIPLKLKSQTKRSKALLWIVLLLSFSPVVAQVESSVDTTKIKIGEQITFKLEVISDTTDLVVFPEGQTFLPLEVIESYPIDTTKRDEKYFLIKEYGLTQFDSGGYTLPSQKVVLGTREFFTDSVLVEVNAVEVDTTKQKLYDIKPIIGVDKSFGDWWKTLLIILLILGIVAFLLYWFVWRKKPLTEEEQIAMLPPYERAKLALQALDNSNFLENNEIKSYYSELTLIIRKYLDEKVYDHSLESTTEELVDRLKLLKDGNQMDLDLETIKNIGVILRRADLVKFAKSKPDIELAKLDRGTIDLEIDHVKESLPEPTEEELLADQQYQEELERKKKRKKIIITAVVAFLMLVGTVVGLSIHYGFNYVKDTVLGHPSKELLESKEWVTSEYGAPGITISTPVVLERQNLELPEEFRDQIQMVSFGYGSILSSININVSTSKYNFPSPEQGDDPDAQKIDLFKSAEGALVQFEQNGVQNIITKNEQFITPNGQEGLKTFGTADFPSLKPGKFEKANYVLLGFTTENILQSIVLAWRADDVYADELMERVIGSIELIKLEQDEQ